MLLAASLPGPYRAARTLVRVDRPPLVAAVVAPCCDDDDDDDDDVVAPCCGNDDDDDDPAAFFPVPYIAMRTLVRVAMGTVDGDTDGLDDEVTENSYMYSSALLEDGAAAAGGV